MSFVVFIKSSQVFSILIKQFTMISDDGSTFLSVFKRFFFTNLHFISD